MPNNQNNTNKMLWNIILKKENQESFAMMANVSGA